MAEIGPALRLPVIMDLGRERRAFWISQVPPSLITDFGCRTSVYGVAFEVHAQMSKGPVSYGSRQCKKTHNDRTIQTRLNSSKWRNFD